MKRMINPAHIVYLSNQEIADMVSRHKLGLDIDYLIDDVSKEIAYRKILNEWVEDGCGHDLATQNDENYNEPDYEPNYQDND